MNRDRKQEVIQDFGKKFENANSVFVVDYRGLKVEEVNALRCKLREVGSEYRVGKNTLLKRAIEGTTVAPLMDYLEGPTAIAVVRDDPVAAAKVLIDYGKDKKNFELKVGCINGRIFTGADVERLSQLPSREMLLAKLLGTLNAPIANFVGVLAALPASLVRALAAIQSKKSEN